MEPVATSSHGHLTGNLEPRPSSGSDTQKIQPGPLGPLRDLSIPLCALLPPYLKRIGLGVAEGQDEVHIPLWAQNQREGGVDGEACVHQPQMVAHGGELVGVGVQMILCMRGWVLAEALLAMHPKAPWAGLTPFWPMGSPTPVQTVGVDPNIYPSARDSGKALAQVDRNLLFQATNSLLSA